jgi:hypothetical protein
LNAQAATLATELSVRPALWPAFYAELAGIESASPAQVIVRAIGLGWSAKWAEEGQQPTVGQC